MSSPDHHPSEHTQPSYPKSSAPGPFLKELYVGWKSLGPGNIWFWITPVFIACAIIGVFQNLLG